MNAMPGLSPEALLREAIAMSSAGHPSDAVPLFREYARICPDDLSASFNLAKSLRDAGLLHESVAAYREAARLCPYDPYTWYNLGNVLRDAGELLESAEAYRTVIRLDPGFANAYNNIGLVYTELGRDPEAIAAYRKARDADPGLLDARMNLSAALLRMGNDDEAESLNRGAIADEPRNPVARYNLGGVLRERGDFAGAIAAYDVAIALRPEYGEALNNRGVCRLWNGDPEAALDDLDACIALMPDYPDAHYNRAFVLLLLGDFPRGWLEYEWRFHTTDRANPSPVFESPPWRGEELQGKRLLVYTEQGFGDAIQFIRCIALLAESGALIMLRCQTELTALFRSIPSIESVVTVDTPLPVFDFHVSLLSLPGLLGISVETVPCIVPYLYPTPGAIARWGTFFGRDTKVLSVGFAGSGSTTNRYNRARNCPDEIARTLGEVQDVELISLEKKDGRGVAEGQTDWLTHYDDRLTDFGETAGLIHHLDLVITVDTAVAHLAGALGKPVWLMLPFAAEWRWLRHRETSPWYPTMRVFRQQTQGDWPELIGRVKRALADRARQQKRQEYVRDAQWYFQRGNVLAEKQEYPAAADAYSEALAISPLLIDARHNLGVVLLRMGKAGEAAGMLESVVGASPDSIDARSNLASALLALGDHARAREIYLSLMNEEPASAEHRFNCGNTLVAASRFAESIRYFAEAIDRDPKSACAHNNLGYALQKSGDIARATAAFERATAIDAQYAEAHWNLATALLAAGDFERGWREFEWRWKRKDFLADAARYTMPLWDGSDMRGSSLLVHAEQGLGDTIHFARYLGAAAQRCGHMVFECPQELTALFDRLPENATMIPRGSALPKADRHVPLLSLPGIFGVRPAAIADAVPYLVPARSSHGSRTARRAAAVIGVVWSGSETNPEGRDRSISAEVFAPVCDVAETEIMSLQTGSAAGELSAIRPSVVRAGSGFRDFADTAAAAAQCDLIITIDTAAAHLAGAMGKKVWTLLTASPDWRWQLGETTTPWYPTMKLFRQRQHGGWNGVIAGVVAELQLFALDHAAASRGSAP